MIRKNTMDVYEKPPLGLEPKWIHDVKRIREILDAIERYSDANMPIPKVWVDELRELFYVYIR